MASGWLLNEGSIKHLYYGIDIHNDNEPPPENAWTLALQYMKES